MLGRRFIGLEMAENLVDRGIAVTIVELADQVLAPLDPEMAALVQQRLTDGACGCGRGLGDLRTTGDRLSDGPTVPADLLVAAIGVRADSHLARARA